MSDGTSGARAPNPLAAVALGQSLAEAIVDTVREPLVVLDQDLRVIAASRSFYRTFAAEPLNTQGRMIYELGDGQWNIPALRTVLEDVTRSGVRSRPMKLSMNSQPLAGA